MQMRIEDIEKFPNFHRYVSTDLPALRERSAIISVIRDLAGDIAEETIQNALLWGRGPMIKVANIIAYGKFKPKNPEEILIRRRWVKEFEKGEGLRITKWGQPVQLVEVILLHELTHWADFRDGVDDTGNLEEGDEFEMAVYGYVITNRSAEHY